MDKTESSLPWSSGAVGVRCIVDRRSSFHDTRWNLFLSTYRSLCRLLAHSACCVLTNNSNGLDLRYKEDRSKYQGNDKQSSFNFLSILLVLCIPSFAHCEYLVLWKPEYFVFIYLLLHVLAGCLRSRSVHLCAPNLSKRSIFLSKLGACFRNWNYSVHIILHTSLFSFCVEPGWRGIFGPENQIQHPTKYLWMQKLFRTSLHSWYKWLCGTE